MFGKLKEKLKNWVKGISKEAEVVEEEEKIEETIVEEVKPRKKEKKPEKNISKKEETKEVEKGIKKSEEKISKIEEHEFKIPKEKTFDKEEREVSEKVWGDIEKEENIVEKRSEEPEKKEGFFARLKSKLTKVKITEGEFKVYAEDLEMLLLENNVALEVAEHIIWKLKQKVVGKEILKKEVESEIKFAFGDIIRELLVEPFDIIERIKLKKADNPPYVVLFCGINGSGKTTSIAKVAEYLQKKKLSCVLAAGDTFRAASIEQLKKHGERLGVKVIAHDYNSDPAAVAFDAVQYAKRNRIDAVLIDTAGRMHTSKDLMREIEKIVKVGKPDLKIFVGESITGNDAIEQAKAFNEHVSIDGIILTKSDIDEKGGTALSVGYITKKPILFLGTGQEYEEIEVFDKNKFIEKLGLGE